MKIVAIQDIVFAINTSGTLAIGSICFFIVYTTFKETDTGVLQEFSKRYMMAIALLILYTSYLVLYRTTFSGVDFMGSIRYVILALVFIYLIYATMGFEKVAEKHGISTDDKLEKMKNEEGY